MEGVGEISIKINWEIAIMALYSIPVFVEVSQDFSCWIYSGEWIVSVSHVSGSILAVGHIRTE